MATPHAVTPEPTPSRLKGEGRRFLELVGVCGLVFARPVYDAFAQFPAQFVVRGATSLTIVAWVLIVALLPPAAVWAAAWTLGFPSPTIRDWTHRISVGVVLGLLVVQATGVGRSLFGLKMLGALIVFGIGFALALGRRPWVAMWCRYLAGAPLLFALYLLVLSPAAALVFTGGAASADVGDPTAVLEDPANVVVIVLDELPTASLLDDQNMIDGTLFPHIARLAGDGTFYRNNSTVSPTTSQAVPAILTGRLPRERVSAPTYTTHRDSLFSLLRASYDVAAVESVASLCPPDLCGRRADQVSAGSELLRDARTFWTKLIHRQPATYAVDTEDIDASNEFDQFVATLPTSGTTPVLRFLHVMAPHQPWLSTASGGTYDAPSTGWAASSGFEDKAIWADQLSATEMRTRHVLKLQNTDRMLGTVLDTLEAAGTYDDTLVVLTADHGISFTSHQVPRGLTDGNQAEVLWTPLIIKAPDQHEDTVSDRAVQSVDLLPTIADLLGIEVPWDVDGRSVNGPTPPGRDIRTVGYWRNSVLNPDEDELLEIDGELGYREMLDLPPPAVGTGPLRLWQAGPYGDLVGREVDDVVSGADGPVSYELEPIAAPPADVAADTPAFVLGRVIDGLDEGSTVAVALNGRIAGVTMVRHIDVAGRFGVLAPPGFAASGSNEVELALVEGRPDSPTLTRLTPA